MKGFSRILLAGLLACSMLPAHAVDKLLNKYRIDTAVWCSGELCGQPVLELAPGEVKTFTINADDSRWRLSVEVEPTSETEGALGQAVWLRIDIEQEVDGEWDFITDTIIGTPLGQAGRVTVVGHEQDEFSPRLAPLFVELVTSRVEPAE